MKKSQLFTLSIILSIFLISFISAQSTSKISIETSKNIYGVGEKINVKVSLFDENNNRIDDSVLIIFQDAKKVNKIEKTISSNEFVDIDLGNIVTPGDWIISATYKGSKSTGNFVIETNEDATFELVGDKLKISNVGNTRYVQTIKIIIGNTASEKQIDLGVGKSIEFRLIAPSGVYNIQIQADGKSMISRSNVALTGNAIGIIDESASKTSGITGGLKPNDEDNFSSLKNNMFVYVFIIAILGAMILLGIERRYRKKLTGHK
ncbi:hypothetical protein COU57_00620 [Candidatus Pacearchaeota archaeon CG10_big_fil_rev_8_21_14_0_10_32_14]|nr:MAG: hypothetical protein COU57_00620 [Candidatus Pacearchaeota archaeon CG10_big_fil_rev_8_21_14_0_10_32_14]